MALIEAHGLRKAFGRTVALDGVDLRVEEGRILGLIGPNGAGKTTALNAILGLTPYQGELKVLGRDPWTERDQLMRDVCFIADVAVLPRWIQGLAGARLRRRSASAIRSRQGGRFSRQDHDPAHQQGPGIIEGHGDATAPGARHGHRREIAGARRADARPRHPVSQAVLRFPVERLLRSQPHHRRDHASGGRDRERAHRRHVHQPRSNCIQLQHGGTGVALSEVMVHPEKVAAARALKPIHERQAIGRSILFFSITSDRQQLAALGEVRTPGIADLFVAVLGNTPIRTN